MAEFSHASAPLAPPLPPQQAEEKVSIEFKVRCAPPGWAFEGRGEKPGWDHLTPPAGKYFFYGTLQDPGILSEVLQLDYVPVLRRAQVIGYSLKLWGQYPALVDGPGGAVVQGSIFEVSDEIAAAKLAHYETNAYRPRPCLIRVANGDKEDIIGGYTFKYAGNPADLNDGAFDLGTWLKRMGRAVPTEHKT